MSEKVIAFLGFTTEATHDMPPSQEIIELLEETLKRARSGQIQTIALAWYDPDSQSTGTYVGQPEVGYMPMLGALEILKFMIMREMPDGVVVDCGDAG
jgi:hypothetical protein